MPDQIPTSSFLGSIIPNGIVDLSNSPEEGNTLVIAFTLFIEPNFESPLFDELVNHEVFMDQLEILKELSTDSEYLRQIEFALVNDSDEESKLTVHTFPEPFDSLELATHKNFWEIIVPSKKQSNVRKKASAKSYVRDKVIDKIDSFCGCDIPMDINKIEKENQLDLLLDGKRLKNEFAESNRELQEKFRKIGEYARNLTYKNQDFFSGLQNRLKTYLANKTGQFSKEAENLQDLVYKNPEELEEYFLKSYVEQDTVDLEDILNCFERLSKDPDKMRRMGLIQEYTLKIPLSFISELNISNYTLSIQLPDEVERKYQNLVFWHKASIKFYEINNKFACLPSPCKKIIGKGLSFEDFFHMGILKCDEVCIVNYDKVALLNNLSKGNALNQVTKGLIFQYPNVHLLINPIEELRTEIFDEDIVSSYRVGVLSSDHSIPDNELSDSTSIRSLTLTNLKLIDNNTKEIITDEDIEIGIKVDSGVEYMDDEETKIETSDTLFEFNGELLNINSAFAKAEVVNKSDEIVEKYYNKTDDSIEKSEYRFKKIIGSRTFPFSRIEPQGHEPKYVYHYGVPKKIINGEIRPTPLRYNRHYRFVVFQEFKNGFGLKMRKDESHRHELSVQEILEENYKKAIPLALTSPSKEYMPLENKREPSLINVTFQENSEELVFWSSLESDFENNQKLVKCHILPPVSDLITEWKRNSLKNFNVSTETSYKLKRRANCTFKNRNDYEQKSGYCPEGCSFYCNGSMLPESAPSDYIFDEVIFDSTVIGAEVELFYDEELKLRFDRERKEIVKINHSGSPFEMPGIHLEVVPTRLINRIGKGLDMGQERFIVQIKRGAQLYLKINNLLNKREEENLKMGWWGDTCLTDFQPLKTNSNTKRDAHSLWADFIAERNPSRVVKITHASNYPLVQPEIFEMYTNRSEWVSHIPTELDRYGYKDSYSLETNIVYHPIQGDDKNGNAVETAQIRMKANFERLDAIDKKDITTENGEAILFVPNIVPTGKIEVRMRREEFVDDKDEYIFKNNENQRSSPDMPIVRFGEGNRFSVESEIEFTDARLMEIKQTDQVVPFRDSYGQDVEAFRGYHTLMSLELQVSQKFEEREYHLRNYSKFSGYFPEDSQNMVANLDGNLPRIDKNNHLDGSTFKVMHLSNTKPEQVDVKYIVTTISEEREYVHRHKVQSIQSGNILTIYLKRGRLSSGKNERVGIILDSTSPYNDYYKENNFISKVGKDLVMDRVEVENEFLGIENIILNDECCFNPDLGICHYLPKFDIDRQLWKVEIEFQKILNRNGQELRNPFIQLSLVHYQPFSVNYNKPDDPSIFNDCRISKPNNMFWGYLTPERNIAAFFKPPAFLRSRGIIELMMEFDASTIYSDGQNLKSNFVLTIEGSLDGEIWYPILTSASAQSEKQFHHPLLSDSNLTSGKIEISKKLDFNREGYTEHGEGIRFRNYRARIVEVEWFGPNSPNLRKEILNDRNARVKYIELIY